MKIELVNIRNFRKLKNCHIDFSENVTLRGLFLVN